MNEERGSECQLHSAGRKDECDSKRIVSQNERPTKRTREQRSSYKVESDTKNEKNEENPLSNRDSSLRGKRESTAQN